MAEAILQSFFVKFTTDTKGFDKSIKRIDGSLSKIGKSFNNLQKIVSLAVGGKIVSDMTSFGLKMGLLSSQTNIGVKSLTALSSAFTSAGSNAQTLQGVLTNLESGLAGLSMGDARIAGILSTYGISPYDRQGRIKTSDDILLEVSDWAKQQRQLGRDDRQVRQKLMADFGVDVAMANLMMRGRGAVLSEQQRAITEGRFLSDETSKDLTKLGVAVKEMWDTIKYSTMDAVSTISPLLLEMANVIKKTFIGISDFIKSLVDKIKWLLGDRTPEEREQEEREQEEREQEEREELYKKGLIKSYVDTNGVKHERKKIKIIEIPSKKIEKLPLWNGGGITAEQLEDLRSGKLNIEHYYMTEDNNNKESNTTVYFTNNLTVESGAMADPDVIENSVRDGMNTAILTSQANNGG